MFAAMWGRGCHQIGWSWWGPVGAQRGAPGPAKYPCANFVKILKVWVRKFCSVLGQADDLMSVDTEDHLLLTRQLDDEFQLLAGRMHQLDSHIALDLGNFSAEEIAIQEIEAQHVERSI